MYNAKLTWVTDYEGKKVFTAVHRRSNGSPDGGNFTFEDGHVEWQAGKKVSLGSHYGRWQCFFKIPIAGP